MKTGRVKRSKSRFIPFYETPIGAGFPNLADDYLESGLDLNEHLINHPTATFFVKVEGDSMKGAGIFSGDLLIVDRSLSPNNGDIIVALVSGEFTVKKFWREGKKITLLPENPRYSEIVITEEMDFQVWGVVTYVIHRASRL